MPAETRCRYAFGSFQVDPTERLLLRDGERVAITRKAFDTLLLLIQNKGRLVRKEELIERVWGGAFVEEGNLKVTISMLRKVLQGTTGRGREIETVPGHGYRFAIDVKEIAPAGQSTGAHGGRANTRLMVMPFRILRPDPATDFLGFGVADAIASGLAAVDSVLVQSPAAASRFAVPAVDLKRIAAEAGSEVVLTGTIMRDGDRLRVTAQLLEAPGGTLIWSHRVQARVEDVFDVQNKIVDHTLDGLALKLTAREQWLVKRDVPATPAAYELYLRGNQLSHRGLRAWEDLKIARDLYLRSLDADPRYAPAWAHLGRCHWLIGKAIENPAENLTRAESCLTRALELNPDLPVAHSIYSELLSDLGRASEAMERLLLRAQKHVASAETYAALVKSCRFCGLLEASVAAHQKAKGLDPQIPTSVGHTYFQQRDCEKARAELGAGTWLLDAQLLAGEGRDRDAVKLLREREQSGAPGIARAFIVSLRALLEGRLDEFREAIGRVAADYVDPEGRFYVARFLARLGERGRALEMLERVLEDGFVYFPTLCFDPWFDTVRSMPGFAKISKRAQARRRRMVIAFVDAGGEELLELKLRPGVVPSLGV